MSRRGLNPCITCGTTTLGPKGAVVCQKCRDKIARYDALAAKLAETTEPVMLRYHPYVPGGFGEGARGALEKALEAFRDGAVEIVRYSWLRPMEHELVSDATRPDPYEPDVLAREHGRDRKIVLLPAALARAYADIEALIPAALNEAEAEGRRHGASFLTGLAAGELTLDEFEKRAGLVKDKDR